MTKDAFWGQQYLDSYPWSDGQLGCAHEYLLPKVHEILRRRFPEPETTRVLDLGCGNGAVSGWLAKRGFQVTGVDPSTQGIEQARSAHPEIEFHRVSIYDPLQGKCGTFDLVISLEVMEHVYDPQTLVSTVNDVLRPDGVAVVSTPYHGWLKNVAIALLGQFDDHVDPLRPHGHIKFFSPDTLTALLASAGLEAEAIYRVGRIPPLAKSMVAVARKAEPDCGSTTS